VLGLGIAVDTPRVDVEDRLFQVVFDSQKTEQKNFEQKFSHLTSFLLKLQNFSEFFFFKDFNKNKNTLFRNVSSCSSSSGRYSQ
jgi:hypothetical protein